MLPRSEGGLLMSASPSQDALYSTSPLSEYSATVPDPGVIPFDANRRSTSASEALQYYWSSSAGERNGSVSSNLGMSPLDTTSASSNILTSPYSLSPHPLIPTHQSMSPILAPNKSELSLQALVEQEEQARSRATTSSGYADAPDEHARYAGQLPDPSVTASPREPGAASAAGSSNRRIHLVSYPSDGSISRVADVPPSPSSSNSGESEYSVPEDSQASSSELDRSRILDADVRAPAPRPANRVSPMQRPRGLVDAEGRLDVLLDPSFEEWAHQRAWDPPSTDDAHRRTSSAPISPSDATAPASASASGDKWHTPLTGALLDRRRRASPIMRTPSPQHDRTPRNSTFSGRSDTRTPTAAMPKSGRSLFASPADVSRRSSDAPEREVSGLGLDTARGSRVGLSILGMGHVHDPEMPHSAPAYKTGFGDISIPETRRPTSLLPSVNVASPGHPSTHKLAPPGSDPLMNARRSPEPPPRSELRKPQTRTPTPPGPQIVTSPTSESPVHDNNNTSTTQSTLPRLAMSGLRTQTLPTIINTPNTPVTSPQAPGRSPHVPSPRSHTAPLPSDRSRESSPQPASMTESGTIKDLTNILGGAIDEIGLIDSRDTPPPTIGVPAKQHDRTPLTLAQVPVRSVSSRANTFPLHTPEQQFAQLSPTGPDFSQGTSPSSMRSNVLATSPIGLGIINTVGTVGASVAAAGGAASQRTGNVVRHVRKASSILSLRSSNYSTMSPTGSTFPAGNQLPQAIVYGNIKQLKTAGDRARAYAQFTAELHQAKSGLREWLYQSQYQRPTNSRPAAKAGMAGLGIGMRPPAVGDTDSARNVSGGSEFPMRVDAYTARELSVRNLEPQDAPTALPSNLPYPQLQHQVHMKGSNSVQSLQSLNSLASYKAPPRGLGRAFNFLKREKENTSLAALGPMNPTAFSAMGPPASAKRELRGMPISSPYAGRSSLDSAEPRVQPSLAVPRGPRDVPGRERHSHDGRSSLDSGRLSGPRASPGLGGPRDPPHGASPLSQRDHNAPSDEEVRAMAEMLPHGERAVIRAYLQQYGEPSYAVSAYIEDEKNGTLMRV